MVDRTDRFDGRLAQIMRALGHKRMVSLWRDQVRGALRRQPFSDLHDYYDFQLNLDSRIRSLVAQVELGTFQPQRPLRVRSEKSKGMCRQLVFILPEDALILEAVADFLFPIIREAAPTSNAYFSRNRGVPKNPTQVDDSFSYEWWTLWPEFQSRILEFSQTRAVTVVTDVATYYDTIEFARLRNFLSGIGDFSEATLDFIFFLFERFVWRPDYLPYPGRGLPQFDLDAPRLVAHAFLYEIDELLSRRAGGDFVRWLDDIDFGCDSQEEAKQILGEIDDVLLSRGLHLNSSKTKILSPEQAFEHFQLSENRFLTILQRRIERELVEKRWSHESRVFLRRRFRGFQDKERAGQWQKIFKRYFSLFGKLKDSNLELECEGVLRDQPSIRGSVFRYLVTLGWSRGREKMVTTFAKIVQDDSSMAGIVDVLVAWEVSPALGFVQRMRVFTESLRISSRTTFLAALRLLGKYCSANQIDCFLRDNIKMWRSDPWLGRQVACLWPRMALEKTRETILEVSRSYGLTSAHEVIDNFRTLDLGKKKVRLKVRPYIVAPTSQGRFTLPKTLISMAALQATTCPATKGEVLGTLRRLHRDPVYKWYLTREC